LGIDWGYEEKYREALMTRKFRSLINAWLTMGWNWNPVRSITTRWTSLVRSDGLFAIGLWYIVFTLCLREIIVSFKYYVLMASYQVVIACKSNACGFLQKNNNMWLVYRGGGMHACCCSCGWLMTKSSSQSTN
jgi:hypothetical protein